MRNFINAFLFIIGLMFVGSMGELFPWLNIAGAALVLITLNDLKKEK